MDLDGITLPDELLWTDEKTWTPVVQSTGYSVTGALFIQENLKQKGRPLTFVGTADMGWISRSTVDALEAKRDALGTEMVLTLSDARTFNVMFRQDETPLDINPVLSFNTFTNDEYFTITALRLMEV